MSYDLQDAVHKQRIVRRVDQAILGALAMHANKRKLAYPSTGCLEDDTGFSDRQIQRSLKVSEGRGLITKCGRHKWPNGRYTNIYRFNLDAFQDQSEDDTGDTMSPVINEAVVPQVTGCRSTGDTQAAHRGQGVPQTSHIDNKSPKHVKINGKPSQKRKPFEVEP